MSSRDVRTQLCARFESLGYEWIERHGHEDLFLDEGSGHQVAMVPWPRWGRRVDILTVLSSFPLPTGVRATAFHLDLASQASPDGTSEPGRWNATTLAQLVEAHVEPYLRTVRSAGDVLDLLLAGELRPIGSSAAKSVIQHGYYLAKWWQLHDRLDALREIAAIVAEHDRMKLERAPWGRTELAEVLWSGREMPAPPARPPWGLADQGDPRAEVWYRKTLRAVGAGSPAEDTMPQTTVPSPRTV